MSLPYRISDSINFTVLTTGKVTFQPGSLPADPQIRIVDLGPQPIIADGDKFERSMDLLLRADPMNAYDVTGDGVTRDLTTLLSVPDSIIYIGNGDRQEFPLKPDQSINIRVTRRNKIFFRGATLGLRLHMVAALLDV